MDTETLIPIILGEALLFCLVVIAIMVFQLAKMRRIKKLLMEKLRSNSKTVPEPPAQEQLQYLEYLDQHIDQTRSYHKSQDGNPEISLDIDPDAPMTRRVAALRHAILIAERECFGNAEQQNWDLLASRYQLLIQFHEDFPPSTATGDIQDIEETLNAAHQRIDNLEKFKQLYFDLEKKWVETKHTADGFYQELKALGPQADQAKQHYETTLQKYHETYQALDNILDSENHPNASLPDTDIAEVDRLKQLASEQNSIIDDLKKQLTRIRDEASSESENQELIILMGSMEAELKKQARFMQESETCINLMEQELDIAHKELTSLRSQVKQSSS